MANAAITLSRSFGSLEHLQLVSEEDMREIGLLAREAIVRRTMSGTDVHGAAFKPYSDGYAETKRQALGTDAVNLQVSGGMLNDLTVVDAKADEDTASVTLGWTK